MNFLGDSERDRALGAAFDEACEPYRIGGDDPEKGLTVRPFSLGVFRRAMTMGIEAVSSGFAAVERDELKLVENLEALGWLLCEDEELVCRAIRTGKWERVLDRYRRASALSLFQLGLIRGEVERNLGLVRAAMFGVVKRPPMSDAMERAEEEERENEPSDILTPGRLASITLGIYEKTGWSEFFVQERLPLCRLLAYSHGVMWCNPRVWTVEPDGATIRDDVDPLAGLEEVREVRTPVEIEF